MDMCRVQGAGLAHRSTGEPVITRLVNRFQMLHVGFC